MAKGNGIIVTPAPAGKFHEGIISGTPKPGTVMQKKASTEPVGGRFTYEVFNKAASGSRGRILILLPDELQGIDETTAYVTGTRCFLYEPVAGEDFNMLIQDQAGTGATSDYAISDELMVEDTTGLLIDVNSEESGPFELNETITDLTADYLAWVTYTGY